MSRVALLPLLAATLLASGITHAQDLPESSPQALLHHAQGVDAYVKERYDEALEHFRLAYESDPTFYVALFMAGLTAGNAGQGEKADSFYALVAPHKEKLSPYYRYRLEAQMASRAGDMEGYLAGNRRAAALGPGTKASYNLAQGVIQRGMAGDARNALRQLDPDREPMKGWWSYYSVYANAAHQLGDYEDELRMARRGRAAFPDDVRAAGLEAEALAALGRTGEAEKVLADIQKMPARGMTTPGQVMTNVALELGAHGDTAASRRWLENAIRWFDALPAGQAKTADNRGDKAYALYALGRFADAAAIHRGLAAEFPNAPVWQAWMGYMAGRLGDKARARDVAARIESGDIRFNAANSALWRALIAAGMDDRAAAVALFEQSGVRPRWMHRDPVLRKALAQDQKWLAYLKPRS